MLRKSKNGLILSVEDKMNRRSSTEWEAIVRQYQQSGMTQKAFCEIHGIKHPTLSYWSRKVNRIDRGEEDITLVELPMPITGFLGDHFLKTTFHTDGITVPLEEGDAMLRITGTVSIEQLGRIIQACNFGGQSHV